MRLSAEIEILRHSNEIVVSQNGNVARIKIEHQLMQILVLLTEYEGQLIEKQLFIDRIWDGNNYTGDAALTKNIFKLRELLKTNHIEHSILIETIPKKGYRLLINRDYKRAKARNYTKAALISGSLLALFFIILFIYRSNMTADKDLPLVISGGKDSVIQLGKKKVQVINIDTATKSTINPNGEKK